MRGLGAALTMIGQQGMERQARAEQDARLAARETALARLQAELREQAADSQSKRELNEYAAQTPLVVDRQRIGLETEQPYRIAAENRADQRQQDQERRGEQRTIRQENRENRENDRRFTRQQRAEEAREAREAERRGNPVVDRYFTEDNRRVLVLEDGTERVLTHRGRPPSTQSDDLSDEGSLSGGGQSGGGMNETLRADLRRAAQEMDVGAIIDIPGVGRRELVEINGRRQWQPPRSR